MLVGRLAVIAGIAGFALVAAGAVTGWVQAVRLQSQPAVRRTLALCSTLAVAQLVIYWAVLPYNTTVSQTLRAYQYAGRRPAYPSRARPADGAGEAAERSPGSRAAAAAEDEHGADLDLPDDAEKLERHDDGRHPTPGRQDSFDHVNAAERATTIHIPPQNAAFRRRVMNRSAMARLDYGGSSRFNSSNQFSVTWISRAPCTGSVRIPRNRLSSLLTSNRCHGRRRQTGL